MSSPDVGFWRLIFPDFLKLPSGGVEAVTPILTVIIWVVAVRVILLARQRSRDAVRLIREARELGDASTSTGVMSPGVMGPGVMDLGALASRSATASPVVREAWDEYRRTLVRAGSESCGSVPAEVCFTERRFAPKLIGNRLLNAAPTALTTMGLLGTFIGLTVGLRNLDLGATPDELRTGIQTLVGGAALGFTASLWGVAASLVTNVHQRWREREVLQRLHGLHAAVDGLFTAWSPEQALSDIAHHAEGSDEALQVLHEKIGSALQESVKDVGESTSRAVSAAIQESLTPVMQDIAQRASAQSAEVFKNVSDQLTSSFREMGTSLATELKASSEAMRETLDRLGEQLVRHGDEHLRRSHAQQDAAVEHMRLVRESSATVLADLQGSVGGLLEDLRATTTHQMDELQKAATTQLGAVNAATERQIVLLDESLPKVVAGLEQAASVVGSATDGMASASDGLSRVATEFAGASIALTSMLADSLQAMTAMADKTAITAQSLTQQQEVISDLTRQTGAAVAVLEEVASALNGGFVGMRSTQREFLEDLQRQLVKHTETMSGWLASYADEVSKQTNHRMGEWNTQTERFTSTMVTATQSLSDAIDELDPTHRVAAPPTELVGSSIG